MWLKNSCLVFELLLNEPCIELVIKFELEKLSPLIIEQVCLASTTTPSPCGEIIESRADEIWFVKFSCT